MTSASGSFRDQAIRLVVAGEVKCFGHDSILARQGIQAACRIQSRRQKSLQPRPSEDRAERTPWLVLSGVHIAVAALVAVVLGIAFAAYLLA